MKIKKFLTLGLVLLLLPSCNNSGSNNDEVVHLDHSDYDISDTSKVCRSSLYDDERSYFDICNNVRLTSESNTTVYPFDTSIFVRYSADNLSTTQIEEIEEIVGENLIFYHRLLDSRNYYRDDNNVRVPNIRGINAIYGTENTLEFKDKKAFDEIKGIIDYATKLSELSKGNFNVFIGQAVSYWESIIAEAQDSYEMPIDPSEYETRRPERYQGFLDMLASIPTLEFEGDRLISTPSITTTESDGSYFISFPKYKDYERITITLGAIAKGYALERIKQELIAKEYTKGIIYGGGSSILSLGDSYRDEYWKIDTVNPIKRSESLGTYNMKGAGSYTTSGDQARGYTFTLSDGTRIRRHHIINPLTGYPSDNYRSVSVVNFKIDAGLMDGISTTLMNLALDSSFKPQDFISAVATYYLAEGERDSIYYGLYEETKQASDTSEGELTVHATKTFLDNFDRNKDATNVTFKVI